MVILSVFLMQVLIFIAPETAEHNYRAVGVRNPQKEARIQGRKLQNKCNEAVQNSDLCNASYSYVKWVDEVESCPQYQKALEDIKDLYKENDKFRNDVREPTEAALRGLQKSLGKGASNTGNEAEEQKVDVDEGALYLLTELAFFMAVPSIYEKCDEFVFVRSSMQQLLDSFVISLFFPLETGNYFPCV